MKPETYKRIMAESTSYKNFAACFSDGCTRCSLSVHQEGHPPVLYRGNPESKIMLIGEAPGKYEQRDGSPFVGPAGILLDKIFSAIGMDTNRDMLITNIVYCRPTAPDGSGKQNYTPKTDQVARCWPFGEKAISLLDPRIIIACGRPALQTLMGDNKMSMGAYEGRWLDRHGRKVFVMMHPAALLHKESKVPREEFLASKKKVWEYMQYFRDTYKEKLDGNWSGNQKKCA